MSSCTANKGFLILVIPFSFYMYLLSLCTPYRTFFCNCFSLSFLNNWVTQWCCCITIMRVQLI